MEKADLAKKCGLLLMGGSAGSLQVIIGLLHKLEEGLPFPVLLVLHRMAGGDSLLAEMLDSRSPLPVQEVEDKEPLMPGVVYLAPSDYHVLLEKDGTFALDASEKIHYSRPSIDVSFESAAAVYGPRLACVLLSGANADGTEGLRTALRAGARVAVQDPDTALFSYMPQHALDHTEVEKKLTTEGLADFVRHLAQI